MELADVRTTPLRTHLHALGSLRFQEIRPSVLLLWSRLESHCKNLRYVRSPGITSLHADEQLMLSTTSLHLVDRAC